MAYCLYTHYRTGSDKWWAEMDYGNKCCICRYCKYWVENHPMENQRIGWDKINEMTMAVSIVLTKFGLDGYQFNEVCNHLRMKLQENFEFNNFNYCPMLGHGVDWIKLRESLTENMKCLEFKQS